LIACTRSFFQICVLQVGNSDFYAFISSIFSGVLKEQNIGCEHAQLMNFDSVNMCDKSIRFLL